MAASAAVALVCHGLQETPTFHSLTRVLEDIQQLLAPLDLSI